MLDLAFVRDNLLLLEEKLRQRGMDPADVLKDFREIDTLRRQAITQMETLKAERNRASEDIARLKKSGQDASAQVEQTKSPPRKVAGAGEGGRGTRRPIAPDSDQPPQPAACVCASRPRRGR